MRPLLQQALKSSKSQNAALAILHAYRSVSGSLNTRLVPTPWICQKCRNHSRSPSSSGFTTWQRRNSGLLRHGSGVSGPLAGPTKLSSRQVNTSGNSSSNDVSSTPRKSLPSHEESRRSHLAKRFSHVMDNVQSNIFIAGQRLNDLTGYSGIEALKKEIEEQEELVRITRSSLQQAKEAYTTAIAQRSASQREVNELLQRKHAWSPQDLERFTSLYRSDHANEQNEAVAQEAVAVAERKAEEASTKLGASILARYHEEQIWSDKIRRMSTWGTWGLMGVNVLLFLVFQIGVEPWRRKRLVKGFEEKVMQALEKEGKATNAATGAALAALQASHTSQATRIAEVLDQDPVDTIPEVVGAVEGVVSAETNTEPGALSEEFTVEIAVPPRNRLSATIQAYRVSVRDLFSERQITLRKVDLTSAALEGAFAGIALASIIGAILRNR